MAKGNTGESKPPRPARRRTDKAAPAVTAQAPDKGRAVRQQSAASSSAVSAGLVASIDTASAPNRTEVQRRAYELFVKRGGGHGRDLEDWLEAERQLRRQAGRELPRS